MPDITMCSGVRCPRAKQCYRYTAQPSTRQSYFAVPPLKADDSCTYFAPTEDKK